MALVQETGRGSTAEAAVALMDSSSPEARPRSHARMRPATPRRRRDPRFPGFPSLPASRRVRHIHPQSAASAIPRTHRPRPAAAHARTVLAPAAQPKPRVTLRACPSRVSRCVCLRGTAGEMGRPHRRRDCGHGAAHRERCRIQSKQLHSTVPTPPARRLPPHAILYHHHHHRVVLAHTPYRPPPSTAAMAGASSYFSLRRLLLLLLPLVPLLGATTAAAAGANSSVTYDHRSLIISGRRRLLISTSIHYPRSVPEVCTPPRTPARAHCGGTTGNLAARARRCGRSWWPRPRTAAPTASRPTCSGTATSPPRARSGPPLQNL